MSAQTQRRTNSGFRPGDVITLPEVLGGHDVVVVDEYSPGLWQVRLEDTEFVISNHVLWKTT